MRCFQLTMWYWRDHTHGSLPLSMNVLPCWTHGPMSQVALHRASQCAIAQFRSVCDRMTFQDCHGPWLLTRQWWLLFEWDGLLWEACMSSTYMHTCICTLSPTYFSTSITVLRSTDLPVILFWYIIRIVRLFGTFCFPHKPKGRCFYSILSCRGEQGMTAEQR